MIFSRKLYLGLGAMSMMGRVMGSRDIVAAASNACNPCDDSSDYSDPPTPENPKTPDLCDEDDVPEKPVPDHAGTKWGDRTEPVGPRLRHGPVHKPVQVKQWEDFLPQPVEGSEHDEYNKLRAEAESAFDHYLSREKKRRLGVLRKKLGEEKKANNDRLHDYWRNLNKAEQDEYSLKLSGEMIASDPRSKNPLTSVEIEIFPVFITGGTEIVCFRVRFDEQGEKPVFGDLISNSWKLQRLNSLFCSVEYELVLKTSLSETRTFKFWLYAKFDGNRSHRFGEVNGISRQIAAVYTKLKNDAEMDHRSVSGTDRRRLHSLLRRLDTCSN